MIVALRNVTLIVYGLIILSCRSEPKKVKNTPVATTTAIVQHAKGFSIEKSANDVTIIEINAPWPDAEATFTYALVPKEKMAFMTFNADEYDAIIATPINNLVVTSTTHISALEALGVLHTLVGFPDTQYISSKVARSYIDQGKITELGNNEAINTEMVLELHPELVVGFSINGQNKAYKTIQRSRIPVVYNGDWTEKTPLGKAEWIKFFACFFQKEKKADEIFRQIETDYHMAKELAQNAKNIPKVMSGALYKDVWYLPGGSSWAAQFIKDANANYLWQDTKETGSLSLSWETVLDKGKNSDFWIAPAQFTSYTAMNEASPHYQQFLAFQKQRIYTFSTTKGETGGLLYYELAPQRPDLVLKDLISIFHPELLPQHQPFFFKPLH